MSGFAMGGAGLVPNYNPADFAFMAGGNAAPEVAGMGSLMASSPSIDPGYGGVPALQLGAGGGGMGALGIANGAISGLQALGSLWMANKAMKLAKKQFKFTKDITNINLNNQMQSYNTALADRARSRGVMEGQTPDQVAGYVSANQLTRSQGKNNGYSPSAVSAAALSNYSDYLARGTSGYTGGSSSSSSSTANAAKDDEKTGN